MNQCNHFWVLVDESTWAEPGKTLWACTDCPETTPNCHTCNQPSDTSNLACTKCINRAKNVLDDIDRACNEPMATHLPIRAIRYDKQPTPQPDVHLPFGIGAEQDDLEHLATIATHTSQTILDLMKDPENLLEILHDWADAWAQHQTTPWDGRATTYLRNHLTWAANNPDLSGWHDYTKEARKIRTKLLHLVGLAPNKHPRPCIHCGGTIIQEQTDFGLEDRLRCTGCMMTWNDREDLHFIERQYCHQAPQTHPDLWVTTEEARAALPWAKRNTINKAISRDRKQPPQHQRIPQRGTTPQGQPLYRLGDITNTLQKQPPQPTET